MKKQVNIDILRKMLVEWIVERRHAFTEIESPKLRAILEYLDPISIKAFHTANILRADCLHYLQSAKSTVIKTLSLAQSRIHLSFDLWTSPNYKAMLAVTAHWTDMNYKAQAVLLAIREIKGSHTGDNISATVHKIAQEFDFADRIGYFIGDNATNNDTAIEHLDRRIRESDGFGMEFAECRLRCFGHIMNLVVKKLLFDPKGSELEAELEPDLTPDKKAEIMKIKWRAYGAVGKCHNVIKYIRYSPQRRQVFLALNLEGLEVAVARIPVMDNDTRWGSVMTMIEVALEQRIRIEAYCRLVPELAADQLTEKDWNDLNTVLLLPLNMLTE